MNKTLFARSTNASRGINVERLLADLRLAAKTYAKSSILKTIKCVTQFFQGRIAPEGEQRINIANRYFAAEERFTRGVYRGFFLQVVKQQGENFSPD